MCTIKITSTLIATARNLIILNWLKHSWFNAISARTGTIIIICLPSLLNKLKIISFCFARPVSKQTSSRRSLFTNLIFMICRWITYIHNKIQKNKGQNLLWNPLPRDLKLVKTSLKIANPRLVKLLLSNLSISFSMNKWSNLFANALSANKPTQNWSSTFKLNLIWVRMISDYRKIWME